MSYDINFWKQTSRLDSLPEHIYVQLCDGKRPRGLRRLPIKRILGALLKAFPQFDPAEEHPLIQFEEGCSVEPFWNDYWFRFDFRPITDARTFNRIADILEVSPGT